MTIATCPRCGAALPTDTCLEPLDAAPGRLPAYRLRHPKGNGRQCVAYVGPEAPEAQDTSGAGNPRAVSAQLTSVT